MSLAQQSLDLSKFAAALSSLEAAIVPPPKNDRERDGAIQRFEYTFELAWKTAARVLAAHGLSVTSPRAVFRELAAQGWIADPVPWFEYLEARNQTVYDYSPQRADESNALVPTYYEHARTLYQSLADKLRDESIQYKRNPDGA
jgi:nucleotidyltransferase substrate binding protein (TIGR01987 family)